MKKHKKPEFLVLAVLASASLGLNLASTQSASAAGLFELLFGPPKQVQAPAYAPVEVPSQARGQSQSPSAGNTNTANIAQDSQPSAAYCVRRCDGHFFPVSNVERGKAGALCNSLCPAAQTDIYYGAGIDTAHNARGQSYADSPNAFVYRQRIVDQCTCNGKTPFGLAAIDYRKDPLIKSGDVVATNDGFVRATSKRRGEALFTPVKEAWLQNGLKLTSKHIAQHPKVHSTEIVAIRVHPARSLNDALAMNTAANTAAKTTMADATASTSQPVRRIDEPRVLTTE